MKRLCLAAMVGLGLTVLAFSEEGRVSVVPAASRREQRESQEQRQQPRSPSVIIKMRHQKVPHPDVIKNPAHIVRDPHNSAWPNQNWRGSRSASAQTTAVAPPQQHTTIVRSPRVVGEIQKQQRVEVVPRRYYWHTVDGKRYAHYYDGGIHWYGFYHGPNFYWTRFYGDRWWWFDVRFGRWVYWWDDYWWWPSPSGVAYVYVGNNYYPYDQAGVVVKEPEVAAPPANEPSSDEGNKWENADGHRMVQVFGSRSEAFLYDTSSNPPVFLKYLGDNVEKVKFSGGKNQKPLKILVEYKDSSFAMFSADGSAIDTDETDSLPEAPPIPSDSQIPAIPPASPQ